MTRGLVLLLLLGGCVASRPLQDGERFRLDVSCRGGGERTLVMDAAADFGSPLGYEVPLDDVTTADDAVSGLRRIRIGAFRRNTVVPGAPTKGHIEWRELANRSPTELVLEYKGHHDLYHVVFPPHGVTIDPASGEFTRICVKP